MEDDLTKRWEMLNLIEEEQQELLLPEEDNLIAKLRGSHCLFAYILSDKNANREAFKSTMAKVWNLAGWLTFKDLDPNKFLLEFQMLLDKKKVLQGRSWSFDRHIIYLKEFEGELSPSKVSFTSEPFGVQVHNLPFASMNEHLGKKIRAAIDKVHTMEVDDQGYGWGSYLRIRVDVNVNKPLLQGRMISLGDKQCWTYFKYERLTTFCFKCGLMKHVNDKCPNFNLVSQSQEQYWHWLRAASGSPQPSSGKKYGGSPVSPSNRPSCREQSEVAGDGNVVVEKLHRMSLQVRTIQLSTISHLRGS